MIADLILMSNCYQSGEPFRIAHLVGELREDRGEVTRAVNDLVAANRLQSDMHGYRKVDVHWIHRTRLANPAREPV